MAAACARRRALRLPPRAASVVVALILSQLLARPASADDATPPTIARVSAVYSILASERSTTQACHPVLISERELLKRQAEQQPWALKYQKPLAAVGLGLASAVFYRDHMDGVLNPRWDRWKWPFIAANAVEGYMLGPGPAIGGWAGAEIGVALGHGSLLAALGGNVLGSVLGAVVWNFFFPPNPALAPLSNDPDGDIPVQRFFKDSVCAPAPTRRFDAPQYRVEFTLDGVLHYTDLAYDPGEALLIAADGAIIGPSRVRIEE